MDNKVNTDLVDYSRQEAMESEYNMSFDDLHIIVGCGGIGYWLGLMLAMLGYHEFILVDGDKIDNSNLNRLPVPQTWIGINKAIVLRKHIQMLRPCSKIIVMSKHIDENNVDMLIELQGRVTGHYSPYQVWDCTDNLVSQRLLYKMFDSHYTKLGYEGLNVGAYRNYSVWDDGTQTRGYRTSMANVLSSMMGAGFGILHSISRRQEDSNINLMNVITGVHNEQEE